MSRYGIAWFGLTLLVAGTPPIVTAQSRPDPAALIAAQKEAMTKMAVMDGVWRGSGWVLLPSGEKQAITQTERVGPFLEGAVRVLEGRGYGEDGELAFNALGIVSYDPAKRQYSIRSYAQGRSGDFVVTPTAEGFQWEIPAGPMTIRYTAAIKDGSWTETGDRITPGRDSVRFFEMTLSRVGDSNWPAAGAVGPR